MRAGRLCLSRLWYNDDRVHTHATETFTTCAVTSVGDVPFDHGA